VVTDDGQKSPSQEIMADFVTIKQMHIKVVQAPS
jgi:hypothetical protein